MKSKLINLKNSLKLGPSNLLVSSPHPISNLRLLKFKNFKVESEIEREYKERVDYLQTLGHNFWYENNLKYQKEKLEFETNILKQNREPTKDDYTVFYNDFLTQNSEKHKQFHINWVKECFKLILPSLKLNIYKIFNLHQANTDLSYFNSNN